MPDILIRGMKMPQNCVDCYDADLPTAIAWLGAKCPWAHGIIDPGVYDLRQDRHPNCPLHELPEHGDLIDRDALVEEQKLSRDYHAQNSREESLLERAIRIVREAPVVVPAERREE